MSAVFGVLDLHGEPRVSWTTLNQTATRGATSLVLSMPVDWRRGDEVVIATTGYAAAETETMTIDSVSGDKRTITLTQPLAHAHTGK